VGSLRTSKQAQIELGPLQRTHLHFCFSIVLCARGVVALTAFISLIKYLCDMVPGEMVGSAAFYSKVKRRLDPDDRGRKFLRNVQSQHNTLKVCVLQVCYFSNRSSKLSINLETIKSKTILQISNGNL
jgi:hypothetical protein